MRTTDEIIADLRGKLSRDNRALLDEAADAIETANRTLNSLKDEIQKHSATICPYCIHCKPFGERSVDDLTSCAECYDYSNMDWRCNYEQ